VLRRSQSDRVAAGVAGGLGEYFGVDPVLFRVLFATAAFFGGAGVLGYLLAWAAIPDAGTERAPIDGWVRELRRRRAPFWLVVIAATLLFWTIAFSWWAPGPSFPVILIVIILVAIFGRRGRNRSGGGRESWGPHVWGHRSAGDPAAPASSTAASAEEQTVNLSKSDDATAAGTNTSPSWVGDTRAWISESREASRIRRRRAQPVKIAGIVALTVTLTVLALADALHGIIIPAYFWVSFGIVGAALLTGLVLRRTPWSLTPLLVLSIIGLIGFGNTQASLHDGFGQKEWRPTSTVGYISYRLAFGQGVLDLRGLPPVTAPETIDITMAGGQARVIVPTTMNVSVRAEVHFGNLTVDGNDYNSIDGWRSRGINLDRTVTPPTTATGAPVLVRVHLADGNISVVHA
jgi:phage shock protein PspC (stress-responsive transcriptional regulator)/FtsH-binding integral membrane protein